MLEKVGSPSVTEVGLSAERGTTSLDSLDTTIQYVYKPF